MREAQLASALSVPAVLLMRLRFSSMTRIGICRCEVATGIERLAVMFSAIRAAAPRKRNELIAGADGLDACAGGRRFWHRNGCRSGNQEPRLERRHASVPAGLVSSRIAAGAGAAAVAAGPSSSELAAHRGGLSEPG